MNWPLTVSIALPVVLGAVAGMATGGETRGQWYASLRKPSWQPPGAVFGPVWTTLYILMGVACYRVWAAGAPTVPLFLYGLQLALNIVWSFAFFRAHNIGVALVDIVVLLATLVATAVSFYRVDPTAGLLLVPYVAWVCFATALNANLYMNNPEQP